MPGSVLPANSYGGSGSGIDETHGLYTFHGHDNRCGHACSMQGRIAGLRCGAAERQDNGYRGQNLSCKQQGMLRETMVLLHTGHKGCKGVALRRTCGDKAAPVVQHPIMHICCRNWQRPSCTQGAFNGPVPNGRRDNPEPCGRHSLGRKG